jgi:NAD+ synthase (glutamine-hydrolysing)
MKVALAQLNYRVGDFAFNTAHIIENIETAKQQNADLIVFAELSVCGYPPRDFLGFNDFINRCEESIHQIAAHCDTIAAIVGAPSRNSAPKGKPLFNSAYFLADGEIRSVTHKTLLPNYDVFDEYRYFEPNQHEATIIGYKGWRLALTVCEDLWNITDDPLYVRNPMDELALLNPDLLINIAASPFHYHQKETREAILSQNAVKYNLPLVYVNQTGGQTELIFDGCSMVFDPEGNVIASLKEFEEDLKFLDIDRPTRPEQSSHQHISTSSNYLIEFPSPAIIDRIYAALILGIRDYFGKMGFSKAILGLSGGIDSAVTLVLAAEALGNSNVRAVLLPSRFSSDHSISDARELAENINIQYDIIPIEEPFQSINQSLSQQFEGLPFNLAEENIQARVRAVILMALSNKFGYILLNTSNKSEAAVGYGTLYGDMCGGLSVLGDVYKTQVYHLANYINRNSIVIPVNSIIKPPSAELRPNQKDSDSLPDYDILDRILFRYIEHCDGPSELAAGGFDPETVSRILKLVNTNEYKRHQAPPILRVSPKAFGQGRRMPIVGKYLS